MTSEDLSLSIVDAAEIYRREEQDDHEMNSEKKDTVLVEEPMVHILCSVEADCVELILLESTKELPALCNKPSMTMQDERSTRSVSDHESPRSDPNTTGQHADIDDMVDAITIQSGVETDHDKKNKDDSDDARSVGLLLSSSVKIVMSGEACEVVQVPNVVVTSMEEDDGYNDQMTTIQSTPDLFNASFLVEDEIEIEFMHPATSKISEQDDLTQTSVDLDQDMDQEEEYEERDENECPPIVVVPTEDRDEDRDLSAVLDDDKSQLDVVNPARSMTFSSISYDTANDSTISVRLLDDKKMMKQKDNRRPARQEEEMLMDNNKERSVDSVSKRSEAKNVKQNKLRRWIATANKAKLSARKLMKDNMTSARRWSLRDNEGRRNSGYMPFIPSEQELLEDRQLRVECLGSMAAILDRSDSFDRQEQDQEASQFPLVSVLRTKMNGPTPGIEMPDCRTNLWRVDHGGLMTVAVLTPEDHDSLSVEKDGPEDESSEGLSRFLKSRSVPVSDQKDSQDSSNNSDELEYDDEGVFMSETNLSFDFSNSFETLDGTTVATADDDDSLSVTAINPLLHSIVDEVWLEPMDDFVTRSTLFWNRALDSMSLMIRTTPSIDKASDASSTATTAAGSTTAASSATSIDLTIMEKKNDEKSTTSSAVVSDDVTSINLTATDKKGDESTATLPNTLDSIPWDEHSSRNNGESLGNVHSDRNGPDFEQTSVAEHLPAHEEEDDKIDEKEKKEMENEEEEDDDDDDDDDEDQEVEELVAPETISILSSGIGNHGMVPLTHSNLSSVSSSWTTISSASG